jgi:hypothetical protein
MATNAKMEGRPAGASEGARRATGEAPAGRAAGSRPPTPAPKPPAADTRPLAATPRPDPGDRGRFCARRKAETVLRLLRGEDLESLSRALGVTAARLAAWRENFLLAGTAALKTGRPDADNTEAKVLLLQAKIGELTMENELLQQKAERLDARLPLAPRRPRP